MLSKFSKINPKKLKQGGARPVRRRWIFFATADQVKFLPFIDWTNSCHVFSKFCIYTQICIYTKQVNTKCTT